MGMTQGLLATMVAATAPADLRGTAFGFFNPVSGVAMLVASGRQQLSSAPTVAPMNIDWTTFTPVPALAGGIVIGLAAALFLLGTGRVAGIAGIVATPWRALRNGATLRPQAVSLVFIAGLLVSPWVWRLFAPLPVAVLNVGWGGLVVAGLLVGVGVRMGNGCTSGHGVCGLSRLSLRSLVNVLAFMGAGVATVFVLRHVLPRLA